jgi:hypothetical protein
MKKFTTVLSLFISTLLSFPVMSQTGPAGVGTSANNINWHIADSIGLNLNDTISTWSDLSGNGNDLTQSGTSRPIYLTNDINGHASASFDGTDDHMDFNSNITTSNFSYFAVFQRNLIAKQIFLFQLNEHAYTANVGSTNSGIGPNYSNTLAQISTMGNDIYSIISGTATSASTSITGAKNSNYSTKTRAALNGYTGTSTICERFNTLNSNTFYLDADVAEVIFYNEALNTASKSIIDNYLAAKYNITITNDRYAHQATHPHELIGIGQESDGSNTSARGKGQLEITNASDLNDGEYLLVGHDNAGFGTSSSTPLTIVERWSQVWRVDKTGAPGTIDVEFFLGSNSFAFPTSYVVLVDTVDGDFSNGGTFVHTTGRSFNAGNLSISFTNLDLPDGAYFTLAEQVTEINAQSDGLWSSIGTWDCGCIPTSGDEVIIGNTFDVSISGANAEVSDLTIEAGGSLTFMASDSLKVYNSLSIAGGFTAGNGTLAAVGSADPQTFANTSGSSIDLNNLHTSNPDSLVLSSGAWTISNHLRVADGKLNVSNVDSIVLLSDASKTAQILQSTSNAFTGDFIIRRFISARNASWANFSSPVKNGTIADWDDDLYMSGVGGNDGDAQYSNGDIFYSVYSYNRQLDKHDTVSSTATALTPGKGFELWLADTIGAYNGGTVDITGVPNSGDITSTVVDQGWNLLGNPYQCFIEYDTIKAGTILPDNYYVWNTDNGSYDFFSGGGKPMIAPGQGFWARRIPGGTFPITYTESAKGTSTSSSFLRKKRNSAFELKISSDQNPFTHKMALNFSSAASAEIDEQDGFYLPSPVTRAPAIYTKVNSHPEGLIYNSLPSYESNKVVPVSIEAGVAGEYTIDANNVGKLFEDYSCIYLEDKETGETVDLTVEPSYSFYSDKGKYDRFALLFSNSAVNCDNMGAMDSNLVVQGINPKFALRTAYGEWYLDYILGSSETQIIISLYNTAGQKVRKDIVFSATYSGSYPLNLPDLKGIFVIQIRSNGQIVNKTVKL